MRQLTELNRTSAAPSVSNKYKLIQSGTLVETFQKHGYTVERILEQGYNKNSPMQGYGKQLIRLRHPSFDLKIQGLFPEIVIQNSYNGLSSFKLSLGIFRLVCANGLVVGSTFSSRSIRHVGQDVDFKVLEASNFIMSQVGQLQHMINKFTNVTLTTDQQAYFAGLVAAQLAPKQATNIMHLDLLKTRRIEDKGADLWTILNRIQENALRGGLRYQLSELTQSGIEYRNNSTRRVLSLDRNVLLNKNIWNIAESFAV